MYMIQKRRRRTTKNRKVIKTNRGVRKKPVVSRINNNNRKYRQGKFQPKNPQKYVGDVNNIIYRSSWELSFNKFLDDNVNILEWSSEEIAIPYIKPTDGKIHRYFVDYIIKRKTATGQIVVDLIEIKPHNQTIRSRSKNPKTKLYEDVTYAINQAKWEAAEQYAKQRGWNFRVLTEKSLFV